MECPTLMAMFENWTNWVLLQASSSVEFSGAPLRIASNQFLKWNASISKLQFVRSHESCFVQMADVIMGAVNYNLRREKGDVQGKSLAKVKLVDKIKEHGDITRTTPLGNRKFNLFFIKLK